MLSNRTLGIVSALLTLSSIGITGVPAQEPVPATRSSQAIVGFVRAVTPHAVTVVSGERILRLNIDSSSQIWKGKLIEVEPYVHPGDAVVARCASSVSGDLHVESMWVNTVAIFGQIVTVGAGRFEFLTNPDADPASAYKKEIKIARFDRDTLFDDSVSTDLRPGRQVEVIGVSVDADTIQATKIVVYDGKQPTRMQTDHVIIAPNGRRTQPRVPR